MVGDGASIISGLTVGTGFDLTISGVGIGVPVQVVGGVMIAHGATTSALGYINLMEGNRKGGGKSGRKINEKREESLKEEIRAAELARGQAKTRAERDAWTDKIKHLRNNLKKSETHWRR